MAHARRTPTHRPWGGRTASVLLWTEPTIRLGNTSLAGGWNRMLSGLPLIMLEARGPGHIALSDNHAGELVALPLQPGQQMWVREHRLLTATGNVTYRWEKTGTWWLSWVAKPRSGSRTWPPAWLCRWAS